jgi:hypothetical protein
MLTAKLLSEIRALEEARVFAPGENHYDDRPGDMKTMAGSFHELRCLVTNR